eukprot:8207420-Alexandrium_andersonii.AAC.1
MKRAYKDEFFRRYCGLMGRGPTPPSGQQSKADWRNFQDRPPPRVEGRTLEEDNLERDRLIDKYAGSGYDAAQEIID